MARQKRVPRRSGVATKRSVYNTKRKKRVFKQGVSYRFSEEEDLTEAQKMGRNMDAANANSPSEVVAASMPSTGAFRGMPLRFKNALVNTMVKENPKTRKIYEGTETVGDLFVVTGNFKPEQGLKRRGIKLNSNIDELPESQRREVFNEFSRNLKTVDPVKRAIYLRAVEKRLKL